LRREKEQRFSLAVRERTSAVEENREPQQPSGGEEARREAAREPTEVVIVLM